MRVITSIAEANAFEAECAAELEEALRRFVLAFKVEPERAAEARKLYNEALQHLLVVAKGMELFRAQEEQIDSAELKDETELN